ncbi:hypothetical protein SAMN05518801_1553 [Novosphingobium sp. CF614]|nr:hypothetical protein SAMN05518801_1553 [Novosphingobium sp. CF614]
MPTGTIDDDDGMRAFLHLAANFGEVRVHGMGVGEGHDQRRSHAARRTDGTKDIGTFIALVAHGAWSGSFFAPDIGECALLTYTGFVLNPDFKALSGGMSGEDFCDFGREVFLKAVPDYVLSSAIFD